MRAGHRISFEAVVSVALAVTIVVFAFGSSSVPSLVTLGRETKWWALAALLPFSVALAWRSRPTRLPAAPVYAFAVLLVAVSLDSAFWSVDPTLTLKRTLSVALLLGVVGSFGLAVSARPSLAPGLVTAIVGAALAEVIGGFGLLFVNYNDAVQASGPAEPERFRGLSENPNTVSLLMAVVAPLALWQVLRAQPSRDRWFWGAAALLIYVTVVASGSRGALLGMTAGLIPFAFVPVSHGSRRMLIVIGIATVFALGVGLSEVAIATEPPPPPPPEAITATTTTATAPVSTTTTSSAAGHAAAIAAARAAAHAAAIAAARAAALANASKTKVYAGSRLQDEIGPGATGRHLFESSGRVEAWYGAIGIGKKRLADGYGFGTEELAFIDRWSAFDGSRPENSFIGLFLQLGLVGLAVLLALGTTMALAARRAVLNPVIDRSLAAACLGGLLGGVLIACFQSYLYSAGNIAALSLWTAAFLVVGLSGAREPA